MKTSQEEQGLACYTWRYCDILECICTQSIVPDMGTKKAMYEYYHRICHSTSMVGRKVPCMSL